MEFGTINHRPMLSRLVRHDVQNYSYASRVVGEIRELANLNHVEAARTCGYWYDKKPSDGPVGHKAFAGEKVVYHLHGEQVLEL
jgi:hypothetical protein